jgi:hypothetical protein
MTSSDGYGQIKLGGHHRLSRLGQEDVLAGRIRLDALYTTAVSVLLQLGLIRDHKLLTPWIDPPVRSMAAEWVGQLQTRLKLTKL